MFKVEVCGDSIAELAANLQKCLNGLGAATAVYPGGDMPWLPEQKANSSGVCTPTGQKEPAPKTTYNDLRAAVFEAHARVVASGGTADDVVAVARKNGAKTFKDFQNDTSEKLHDILTQVQALGVEK